MNGKRKISLEELPTTGSSTSSASCLEIVHLLMNLIVTDNTSLYTVHSFATSCHKTSDSPSLSKINIFKTKVAGNLFAPFWNYIGS